MVLFAVRYPDNCENVLSAVDTYVLPPLCVLLWLSRSEEIADDQMAVTRSSL